MGSGAQSKNLPMAQASPTMSRFWSCATEGRQKRKARLLRTREQAASRASRMLISPKNLSSCAKGAPNVLQFRGPRRQVFVCGVEIGGGESKACPERSRRGSAFALRCLFHEPK